jgi:hypothetical protein
MGIKQINSISKFLSLVLRHRLELIGIYCFCLLLLFGGCVAQKKISTADFQKSPNLSPKNVLIENKYLHKFEGKWHWEKDNKTFEVKFKVKIVTIKNSDMHVSAEMLISDFKYFVDKKKVHVDPKFVLCGVAQTESSPVDFEITFPGPFVSSANLELAYINENNLELRFPKTTPEAAKDKIPIPIGITLKRVK